MKKAYYFLTTVFFTSFVSYAQTDITNDTMSIWTDGSTAIVEYHIEIKNPKNSPVDLKFKKIINSTYTGTRNNFCFDMCYGSPAFESVGSVTLAAGENNN